MIANKVIIYLYCPLMLLLIDYLLASEYQRTKSTPHLGLLWPMKQKGLRDRTNILCFVWQVFCQVEVETKHESSEGTRHILNLQQNSSKLNFSSSHARKKSSKYGDSTIFKLPLNFTVQNIIKLKNDAFNFVSKRSTSLYSFEKEKQSRHKVPYSLSRTNPPEFHSKINRHKTRTLKEISNGYNGADYSSRKKRKKSLRRLSDSVANNSNRNISIDTKNSTNVLKNKLFNLDQRLQKDKIFPGSQFKDNFTLGQTETNTSNSFGKHLTKDMSVNNNGIYIASNFSFNNSQEFHINASNGKNASITTPSELDSNLLKVPEIITDDVVLNEIFTKRNGTTYIIDIDYNLTTENHSFLENKQKKPMGKPHPVNSIKKEHVTVNSTITLTYNEETTGNNTDILHRDQSFSNKNATDIIRENESPANKERKITSLEIRKHNPLNNQKENLNFTNSTKLKAKDSLQSVEGFITKFGNFTSSDNMQSTDTTEQLNITQSYNHSLPLDSGLVSNSISNSTINRNIETDKLPDPSYDIVPTDMSSIINNSLNVPTETHNYHYSRTNNILVQNSTFKQISIQNVDRKYGMNNVKNESDTSLNHVKTLIDKNITSSINNEGQMKWDLSPQTETLTYNTNESDRASIRTPLHKSGTNESIYFTGHDLNHGNTNSENFITTNESVLTNQYKSKDLSEIDSIETSESVTSNDEESKHLESVVNLLHSDGTFDLKKVDTDNIIVRTERDLSGTDKGITSNMEYSNNHGLNHQIDSVQSTELNQDGLIKNLMRTDLSNNDGYESITSNEFTSSNAKARTERDLSETEETLLRHNKRTETIYPDGTLDNIDYVNSYVTAIQSSTSTSVNLGLPRNGRDDIDVSVKDASSETFPTVAKATFVTTDFLSYQPLTSDNFDGSQTEQSSKVPNFRKHSSTLINDYLNNDQNTDSSMEKYDRNLMNTFTTESNPHIRSISNVGHTVESDFFSDNPMPRINLEANLKLGKPIAPATETTIQMSSEDYRERESKPTKFSVPEKNLVTNSNFLRKISSEPSEKTTPSEKREGNISITIGNKSVNEKNMTNTEQLHRQLKPLVANSSMINMFTVESKHFTDPSVTNVSLSNANGEITRNEENSHLYKNKFEMPNINVDGVAAQNSSRNNISLVLDQNVNVPNTEISFRGSVHNNMPNPNEKALVSTDGIETIKYKSTIPFITIQNAISSTDGRSSSTTEENISSVKTTENYIMDQNNLFLSTKLSFPENTDLYANDATPENIIDTIESDTPILEKNENNLRRTEILSSENSVISKTTENTRRTAKALQTSTDYFTRTGLKDIFTKVDTERSYSTELTSLKYSSSVSFQTKLDSESDQFTTSVADDIHDAKLPRQQQVDSDLTYMSLQTTDFKDLRTLEYTNTDKEDGTIVSSTPDISTASNTPTSSTRDNSMLPYTTSVSSSRGISMLSNASISSSQDNSTLSYTNVNSSQDSSAFLNVSVSSSQDSSSLSYATSVSSTLLDASVSLSQDSSTLSYTNVSSLQDSSTLPNASTSSSRHSSTLPKVSSFQGSSALSSTILNSSQDSSTLPYTSISSSQDSSTLSYTEITLSQDSSALPNADASSSRDSSTLPNVSTGSSLDGFSLSYTTSVRSSQGSSTLLNEGVSSFQDSSTLSYTSVSSLQDNSTQPNASTSSSRHSSTIPNVNINSSQDSSTLSYTSVNSLQDSSMLPNASTSSSRLSSTLPNVNVNSSQDSSTLSYTSVSSLQDSSTLSNASTSSSQHSSTLPNININSSLDSSTLSYTSVNSLHDSSMLPNASTSSSQLSSTLPNVNVNSSQDSSTLSYTSVSSLQDSSMLPNASTSSSQHSSTLPNVRAYSSQDNFTLPYTTSVSSSQDSSTLLDASISSPQDSSTLSYSNVNSSLDNFTLPNVSVNSPQESSTLSYTSISSFKNNSTFNVKPFDPRYLKRSTQNDTQLDQSLVHQLKNETKSVTIPTIFDTKSMPSIPNRVDLINSSTSSETFSNFTSQVTNSVLTGTEVNVAFSQRYTNEPLSSIITESWKDEYQENSKYPHHNKEPKKIEVQISTNVEITTHQVSEAEGRHIKTVKTPQIISLTSAETSTRYDYAIDLISTIPTAVSENRNSERSETELSSNPLNIFSTISNTFTANDDQIESTANDQVEKEEDSPIIRTERDTSKYTEHTPKESEVIENIDISDGEVIRTERDVMPLGGVNIESNLELEISSQGDSSTFGDGSVMLSTSDNEGMNNWKATINPPEMLSTFPSSTNYNEISSDGLQKNKDLNVNLDASTNFQTGQSDGVSINANIDLGDTSGNANLDISIKKESESDKIDIERKRFEDTPLPNDDVTSTPQLSENPIDSSIPESLVTIKPGAGFSLSTSIFYPGTDSSILHEIDGDNQSKSTENSKTDVATEKSNPSSTLESKLPPSSTTESYNYDENTKVSESSSEPDTRVNLKFTTLTDIHSSRSAVSESDVSEFNIDSSPASQELSKPTRALTSSQDQTTIATTESTIIPFHFTIDANYDEVVGTRKKLFEESVTKQLGVAMRIPFSCIQNLQVKKGSIEVDFDLSPDSEHGHLADEKAMKAAADELKRMIDNGQLTINDLDGNTLVVVPLDPPTKPPPANEMEHTTLILGVIIGAFIITVIMVAITAIIVKRKSNVDHRLSPIEEARSKLPSYREIPFQEALFIRGSERSKLMYGKYCYNTGQWLGPGPEPKFFQAPESIIYRPPTDTEIRRTPRPPTAVRERLKHDWEVDWDSVVSSR